MSPIHKDPHPLCAKCRGRSCSRDSTCDVCGAWSEEQWLGFGKIKRKKTKQPVKTVTTTTTTTTPGFANVAVTAPLMPGPLPPPTGSVDAFWRADNFKQWFALQGRSEADIPDFLQALATGGSFGTPAPTPRGSNRASAGSGSSQATPIPLGAPLGAVGRV